LILSPVSSVENLGLFRREMDLAIWRL
jgi:hypothetical protein